MGSHPPPTHLSKLDKASLLESAADILDERGITGALAVGTERCAVGALAELLGLLPATCVNPGSDKTEVMAADPDLHAVLEVALDQFIEAEIRLILEDLPANPAAVAEAARQIKHARTRRDISSVWHVNDSAGPQVSAECFRRAARLLRHRVGSVDLRPEGWA